MVRKRQRGKFGSMGRGTKRKMKGRNTEPTRPTDEWETTVPPSSPLPASLPVSPPVATTASAVSLVDNNYDTPEQEQRTLKRPKTRYSTEHASRTKDRVLSSVHTHDETSLRDTAQQKSTPQQDKYASEDEECASEEEDCFGDDDESAYAPPEVEDSSVSEEEDCLCDDDESVYAPPEAEDSSVVELLGTEVTSEDEAEMGLVRVTPATQTNQKSSTTQTTLDKFIGSGTITTHPTPTIASPLITANNFVDLVQEDDHTGSPLTEENETDAVDYLASNKEKIDYFMDVTQIKDHALARSKLDASGGNVINAVRFHYDQQNEDIHGEPSSSIVHRGVANNPPPAILTWGLLNLGNTCFMNVCLQLLVECPSFKSLLMSYDQSELIACLRKLFSLMERFCLMERQYNTNTYPTQLSSALFELKRVMGGNEILREFMDGEQHCALEFLQNIFQAIRVEEKVYCPQGPRATGVFEMTLKVKLRCVKCDAERDAEHDEQISTIDAPMLNGNDVVTDLGEAVKEYFKEEVLSGDCFCPSCGLKQPTSKKYEIQTMPKYLFVGLKREYSCPGQQASIKITSGITTPQSLSLTPYLCKGVTEVQGEPQTRGNYSVCGIIHHTKEVVFDEILTHYTVDKEMSHLGNISGTLTAPWFNFNDQTSRKTTLRDAIEEEEKRESACIFLYRRNTTEESNVLCDGRNEENQEATPRVGEKEHRTASVAKKGSTTSAVASDVSSFTTRENNTNKRWEKLRHFVNSYDPSQVSSIRYTRASNELVVIDLKKDKFRDEFVDSLERSAIVEVATLCGGCELRRERVDYGSESKKKKLAQSLLQDYSSEDTNKDSSEGRDEDDEETNEDFSIQQCFQFDVTRVNRSLKFLFDCILLDILEKKDLRDSLRRVRTKDVDCYAKGVNSFFRHCSDTVLEAINKMLEPYGVMLPRFQIYEHNGMCTWHQDWERDDFFMLKIGQKGFLQMKRAQSVHNEAFLGVKCDKGALGIDPSDEFVESVDNNVYHTGGGDATATLMFRSTDGVKMTQRQKDAIMLCMYDLDCHLEESMTSTQSTQELLKRLDIRSLEQWKGRDSLINEAHFMFMANYVLHRGGTEWWKKTSKDSLRAIYVHSPTFGRKVSVGYWLEHRRRQMIMNGKDAFTEEQYEILCKIGIPEHPQRGSAAMLHYKKLREFQNQGGDVNKLEAKHRLVMDMDGKMKMEEVSSRKAGHHLNTGHWIYRRTTEQQQNHHKPSLRTEWVFKELGLDWNRKYNRMLGANYRPKVQDPFVYLLRKFNEQGGDINKLSESLDLKEDDNGTVQCVKINTRDNDKRQTVGKWLGNNRGKWKISQISKPRLELLEELGIDWEADFSESSRPQVIKNPHYQILLVYHQDGNDVNILKSTQNLVKSGDNWTIVREASKKEQSKSTGAWLQQQKKSNRRGKLSKSRKDALSAIGVEW